MTSKVVWGHSIESYERFKFFFIKYSLIIITNVPPFPYEEICFPFGVQKNLKTARSEGATYLDGWVGWLVGG